MAIYTVIWRGADDDFNFTEVEVSEQALFNLSGLQWVLEAADVEYADCSEQERLSAKAELFDSYELLDVVKGKLESVL